MLSGGGLKEEKLLFGQFASCRMTIDSDAKALSCKSGTGCYKNGRRHNTESVLLRGTYGK